MSCYLCSLTTALSKAVETYDNHSDNDQIMYKLENLKLSISKYIDSLKVEVEAASDVYINHLEAKDKQNRK